MKQTRQDFFTANGEGIKIMTFTEFARHILRMECGESLELYAVVNRQTRECSRPLSVRKEQWNGTPFYLLGGHGQEVRTINFAGRPKEEFETTCHDALDSYDAVESIGAVVSRLRELSPEELHKRIAEEMKTGCKYLLVYRSEDGKFLCDLYQPDYLHLENGGDIVDTASIPDMHFHSDWAIANPTVRDKVLSSRMVIIYTHETVTL